MALLTLVLITGILLAAWPLFLILQNYIKARRIGLPILITPIVSFNPVWQLGQRFFLPILESLPFGLGGFVYYSKAGWNFKDRYYLHAKYGPAFLIVSPGTTEVVIADSKAAEDILAKPKDWIKNPEMYGVLDIFGPNVDSLNGDAWLRHRRITTPPFNERNSSLVWQESIKQACGMLESWEEHGVTGVSRSDNDTMTLALHVLTAAGFGRHYNFSKGVTNLIRGHTLSYRDSLAMLLQNFVVTVIVSQLPLSADRILPGSFKKARTAITEFQQYMTEMVEEERSSNTNKENLMSVLVRAVDSSQHDGKARSSLSNEEIYGNLFIYNLAGHDTTANTLIYAITLLSMEERWQDWIREEISLVIGKDDLIEDLQYEKAFPQLKRCLGLMYETLRLYGPVPTIPKYTGSSPQILKIAGTEYVIPADTNISINNAAIHTMPEHWGNDSLTWRPNRWMSTAQSVEEEEIIEPAPGSFIPWAVGPRNCPGRKFAMVEFVAVIACLFRSHRVEPVLFEGESRIQGAKRLYDIVEDSEVGITLKMKHPERFNLKWEKVK